MSPRRNRPRGSRRPDDEGERRPLAPEIVTGAPEGWTVRAISPAGATKEYRCPGCRQEIRPGTAHVVAWRTESPGDRRHWHRGCWEGARRRGEL